jgi:cell wall-associated NlpC family hydrolase
MTVGTRARIVLGAAVVVTATALPAAGCATSEVGAGGPSTRATVVSSSPAVPRTTRITAGSSVYVDVAVSTLWVSPGSPRTLDAPALADPVRMHAWLRSMSTAARRDLVGRVETQALYGDRLRVIGVRSHWLHVVAVGQSTHRDSRGYPGWVPRRQVTARTPAQVATVATVTSLTTRLHHVDGRPSIVVGFGTRLPVIAGSGHDLRVATPHGTSRVVSADDVVVRPGDQAALPATVRSVLASARSFTGVPYLWGGRSGFAVDCSGFTGLVLAVHGVQVPRDADDQARAGRAVASGHQRAGDLAFFGSSTAVTHVGFVVGSDRLLQAPGSGRDVTTTSLSSMSGLVAVRRFL